MATLQMPSVTASVKGVCTPHSGLPQPGPLSRCPAVRVLCKLWAPGCSRSTSIYTTLVRSPEPMSLAKPSRVSRLPCVRDMGPQAPLKAGFWQDKVAHRTSLGQLIPSPGPHAVPLAWRRSLSLVGSSRGSGAPAVADQCGGGLPRLPRAWQWDVGRQALGFGRDHTPVPA